MSPLSSSNVDSQGIKYTLINSDNSVSNNGSTEDVRKAIIDNQTYSTGRNIGQFANYVGKVFMLQSLLHTNLYIDAHNVHDGTYANICVWEEDGNGNLNRRWTIDTAGRLINVQAPDWCVYITSDAADDSAGARMTMRKISSLSTSDIKQYWGFDGTHIYLAASTSKYWDLAEGTNAKGTLIALRTGEYSDDRRKWAIVPDPLYTQYNTLTLKRGVMDSKGVIYKLTGFTSLFSKVNSYITIKLPQHKSTEISYSAACFSRYVKTLIFRDKTVSLLYATINDNIISMAYGKIGYYIAISPNAVYRSSDARAWTKLNVSVANCKKVKYLNSLFIIIGNNSGKIQYSIDGSLWATASTKITKHHDIDYGNGLYVIVGGWGSGNIQYSTDLKTWTVGKGGGYEIQSVAYNALSKTWAAVDMYNGSYSSNLVYYSTDGKNWTNTYSSNTQLYSIVATISDGFRAVGKGVHVYRNGGSWQNEGGITSTHIFRSVATNGTYFGCTNVGVGDGGVIVYNVWGTGGGYVSSGTSNNLTLVRYLNGYFIACGNSSTVLYSTNGKSWSKLNTSFTTANATDVLWDGSQYVLSFSNGYIHWFNL